MYHHHHKPLLLNDMMKKEVHLDPGDEEEVGYRSMFFITSRAWRHHSFSGLLLQFFNTRTEK